MTFLYYYCIRELFPATKTNQPTTIPIIMIEKLKWAAAVIIVGVLVSVNSGCAVYPSGSQRQSGPVVASAIVKRVYNYEDEQYTYKLTKVCYTDGYCSTSLVVVCKKPNQIWGCRDFTISDMNRDGDFESITVGVGKKFYSFDLYRGIVTRSRTAPLPNLIRQIEGILVPHASSAVEEIPLRVKPSQVIKI